MNNLSVKQKEKIIELNKEKKDIKLIAEIEGISINSVVSVISYFLLHEKILEEQHCSRLFYFNHHTDDLKKFPEITLIHDKPKVLFYDSGRGRKPVTNKVGLNFSSFLTYNHVYTHEYLLKLVQTFFISSGLFEEARRITIPTIRNSLEAAGYHFTPYHDVKISHSSRNQLNCRILFIDNFILFYIGNKAYFIIIKEEKEKKGIKEYLKMVCDFRISFEKNIDNTFLVFFQDESPFCYDYKEEHTQS